ncbi:MAG: transglycosylase domain-containing protein [Holophagales bacterium]|nr:MAG: transglycosylase domain-containing protein [Holophagales bacterium]
MKTGALARLRRRLPSRRVLGRSALALAGVGAAALAALALSRARLESPAPTLLARDRSGQYLGELPAGDDDRLGFWPATPIPERVAAATLAIEDRRFRLHPGVDPLALLRALRQNLTAGRRVSGASTLAMQVARMQRPGSRGYWRKALEAATALLLTARYGRDAVLAHYLRIVPYGNRIHGIAYAARRYLDKPVDDLSWAEVAFLTAIPQSPARMNPYDPRGRLRAIQRGREILGRLAERGDLPARDLAVALDEIEHLRLPWRGERPAAAIHPLLALARQVPEAWRASRPLLATTLELELQREAEWLAYRTVADESDRGAGNAAVLIVDRASWEVRAAVGSTGYFDTRRGGAIDYLRLPRSSGSTLKPLLFAQALERGTIAPNTVLDDLEPGPGGILNSDERYLGPLLPRLALANSRNVPAVELLSRLGLDAFYGFLADLRLHAHEETARHYGLGLAIGSLPVTLERLVTAYTVLAGDGRLQELRWLAGAPSPEAPRRVSEATARRITLFLADPQARLPTFPRMGFSEYPFPVAVKTGTSSRYRDAWTVAWSERYLVGVWVGHPDERPMSALSGYRIAARLTQTLLERLHRDELDGQSGRSFPPPAGEHAERLCALTGARATAACDRVLLEWLPDGIPAPGDCRAHRQVGIDRRNGAIANAATPPAEVEMRTFVDLPTRYAAWLIHQGVPSLPQALADAAHRAEAQVLDLSGQLPRVEITAPEPGTRMLRDPETPPELNTLRLAAAVEPPVPQLVWYLDGRPLATVERPYTLRWQLEPGEHVFQARVPFSEARSPLVRITVE